MAISVGELSVKLGFDVAGSALKQFDDSIGNLQKNMLGAVAGGTLLADVIKDVVRQGPALATMSYKTSAHWIEIASQTNIARDALADYSKIFASLSGDSFTAEGAGNAIANLDKQLNLARLGRAAFPAVAAFGIHIQDMTGLDFVKALREKAQLEHWSAQKINQVANIAGLGDRGWEGGSQIDGGRFDKLLKEFYLSKEDMDKGEDATKGMAIASQRLETVMTRLSVEAIPLAISALTLFEQIIEKITPVLKPILDYASKILGSDNISAALNLKGEKDSVKTLDTRDHTSQYTKDKYQKATGKKVDWNNTQGIVSNPGGMGSEKLLYAPHLYDLQPSNANNPFMPGNNPAVMKKPDVNQTNHVTIHTSDSALRTYKEFLANDYMNTQANLNNGSYA